LKTNGPIRFSRSGRRSTTRSRILLRPFDLRHHCSLTGARIAAESTAISRAAKRLMSFVAPFFTDHLAMLHTVLCNDVDAIRAEGGDATGAA